MRYFIIPALLFSLSACETWNGFTNIVGSTFESAEVPTCLPVVAPVELVNSSVAAGKGPMDLRANTSLAVGEVECDAADGGGLRQTVTLKLSATKGPALKDGALPVPFFAAVVDTSNAVQAKKLYRTTFNFGDELKAEEEVVLVFNLTAAQSKNANIYVGFNETVPDTL